jgi:hypothetical protein
MEVMENEYALLAKQIDLLHGDILHDNLYRVPIASEIKNVVDLHELHAALHVSDALNQVHHCSWSLSIPGLKKGNIDHVDKF